VVQSRQKPSALKKEEAMKVLVKIFLGILGLGVLAGAGGPLSFVCASLAGIMLLEEISELLREIRDAGRKES
jgi:hypothetical protein